MQQLDEKSCGIIPLLYWPLVMLSKQEFVDRMQDASCCWAFYPQLIRQRLNHLLATGLYNEDDVLLSH